MRSGTVYRRCKGCGRAAGKARRCTGCGSESIAWSYVVDVAPRKAPRQQKRAGGFATKGEAVEAMHRRQEQELAGTYVESTGLTLAAYLEDWLAGVRGDLRSSTWASYRDMARKYVIPRLGRAALQQLTRATIKTLYAELAVSGAVRGGRLSPKSVHNVHLMLRKALADAVEDRRIGHNPADGAHKLSAGRPDMATWSAEQLTAFLETVRGDRLFALWRLAAMTGMRRGELLGTRWADVSLEAGTVRIQQQRVRGADGIGYGAPKTAKGRRRVDLDPTTVAALKGHAARQELERRIAREAWTTHGLVFTMPDGSPLDPDGVSQRFERHALASGQPRIRFHDLRHTHATLALMAGIHPKVVQERLGHSSITVTMDTYSHAIPAMQADAADRIAALVDAAVAR